MRLKFYNISIIIFVCFTFALVCSLPMKEESKIPNKEWYCTHICKMAKGEPYYDEHTEKCYCTIRSGDLNDDKGCKIGTKINPKVHDLHVIFREFYEPSNRVRRSEDDGKTVEVETQTTDIVETAPELETTDVDENQNTNPESPVVEKDEIVEEIQTENLQSESEKSESETTDDSTISNDIKGRKPQRTIQKSAGTSKVGVKPLTKSLNELVSETHQKVDELVVQHQDGKPPKETQQKVKDIQLTLNLLSNRLKQEEKVPALQDRINHLGEKLAARHRTTNPVIIVQPTNTDEALVEEHTEESNATNRRHTPPHRHRVPPKIRTQNENQHEESERARPRVPIRRHQRERVVGSKGPEESEIDMKSATTDDSGNADKNINIENEQINNELGNDIEQESPKENEVTVD